MKVFALATYARANCPEETPYAYDFYGTPMCCEEDVDYYCDIDDKHQIPKDYRHCVQLQSAFY